MLDERTPTAYLAMAFGIRTTSDHSLKTPRSARSVRSLAKMLFGVNGLHATSAVVFAVISLLALALGHRRIDLFDILMRVLAIARHQHYPVFQSNPRPTNSERETSGDKPSTTKYSDQFPPPVTVTASRAIQKQCKESGLPQGRNDTGGLPGEEGSSCNLMPFTASYLECPPSTRTPTHVSIAKVKALGDFPDYAAISDVPLPEPYVGFVIEKALPRPYRPFRWAYHQTMCMPYHCH